MKEKIILGSLIVLFLALAVPTVSAETVCKSCHLTYYNAVNAIQHANSDGCIICHQDGYDTSTHLVGKNGSLGNYLGYIVTATTCNQCHSPNAGIQAPRVDANTHTGSASSPADCTRCHFANTTQRFPLNDSLFIHDHNFTVEYNFYNYNISGMPLSTNGGLGKGMFPYYTCTLTCHKSGSKENITIGWNQSKHAQSFTGSETNYCAKCKSPPNYNVSAPSNKTIAAADWQGIQCRVCHNMHNVSYSDPSGGKPLAFYNSTLSSIAGYPVYEQVHNATELCGKCHSNRNFAGVHIDTAGFDCADCHVNKTFSNYNHTFEVKNTTSGVEGCKVCHSAADHTWEQTSKHTNVECWACHDQTVVYNATSGNATSSGNTFGIWKDPTTQNWTTYKVDSHGNASSWVLHNISKNVSCDKCHIANSTFSGTIGPALTCSGCHSSYGNAVNSSQHNQTLNPGAPACTDCHAGYVPSYGHTTGNKSYIVNGSNTCTNCHNTSVDINNRTPAGFDFGNMGSADCTQCHFANTTTRFSLNQSLYTHDHNNLTVEHNYSYYNQSGTIRMPLKSNGGVGEGQFPFWTCTQYSGCHGSPSSTQIDNASKTWVNSKHAQSLEEPGHDNKMSCVKCHSPLNYNASVNQSTTYVAPADWQGIQCRECHDIMNITYSNSSGQKKLAFYNSTLSSNASYPVYEQVHNATELCEKCHTGSNHDSKFAGIHKDLTGANFTCASCHLNTTSTSRGGFNNKSHSFEVMNVYTGATGCAVCHSVSDHNNAFQFTSNHTGKATCDACHDKTVARNATGYAVSSDNKSYGLYVDPETGNISNYQGSRTFVLHNITRPVDCGKCHGTKSAKTDSLLAPTFGTIGCVKCHPSYASAVNNSMHNKTKNAAAPNCTDCHTGYDTNHTGYTGYIVNESNTCIQAACHASSGSAPVNESHGNHNYGQNYADCTQCHFANTTQQFSLNSSLYTHDHNLTVEYNFYNYNLYGMPLESDHSASKKGMFPYYTCTLTCHNGTGGQPKIENETVAWSQSKHAQIPATLVNWTNKTVTSTSYPLTIGRGCITCKSPTQFNGSIRMQITTQDWKGIQCRVCHNLHNDTYSGNGTPINNIAFYNGTLSNLTGSPVYDTVENATVLCEKCHTGYHNAIAYDGSHKTSLGFTCASCHMNSTVNNGSTHTFEVENATSGATGCEACHVPTSVHTDSNFREYSLHKDIVTCEACHDNTVARNSSDYVVNISTFTSAGIYKNLTTNKWTTYVGRTSATDRSLHNISKSIDCNKCHGARSVISGAIAPNLTSGGISYYTTDKLVSGYNFILVLLYPEPTIYADYLINSSLSGVPGVNKTLNWNSTSQEWEGYENINGVYLGTKFTVAGYKAYFVNASSLSVNKTYTLKGWK